MIWYAVIGSFVVGVICLWRAIDAGKYCRHGHHADDYCEACVEAIVESARMETKRLEREF